MTSYKSKVTQRRCQGYAPAVAPCHPSRVPFMSSMEAAEDVRAKGQLLQEITREAETFERYSPSPAPVGCYRSYTLAPEPQQAADAEYICTFADAPEWSWSRTSTPGEDRVPVGSTASGTLIVTSGTTNETVIGSLQYAVPSHLSPDAFSALPSISVAQPPASTPSLSGSPMQRPLPAPSTLTSSALDLSPMTPSPVTHQLPSLQPSLINATSSHLTAVTAPPSTHQLPPLQPSLTSLDMAAHALTSHHALEGTLDLVGVEGDSSNTQDVPADFEPGQRLSHLKHHMKIHMEELNIGNTKEDGLMFSSESQDLRKTQRQESPEQQYTCKQCGEVFQRAERLKPESPEALTESTPPLQNDSKEVDAMKLLTAVLATPQHHSHQLQQSFPQTSVQQLSHQEHIQQPSHSHLQQQSQQVDHLQQHARQQGHMQQQQQSQQHSHMQQLQRQQSHLQQPSQHQLQPSTRQQSHLHHSQLHQQVEQETHIQRQNHVHHHHHLQFSHDVQQQFFKPSSLSLSTQHHNHQQQEDILSQHSTSLNIPQDLDECSHPHESGHTQQHHLHSHLDQSSLEEHNTNLKHHQKHHHLH
ncbi:hypothetical protein C7M84_009483 [Penaeus vannamei]|uniref:Uncharacterized protein n=1 Tax=Penaeus vannamei TaxID=6689 RepID=A0A423T6N0_PENVA|nr:hypothetical protein C7M84_009483 [Penaeus vannamei]